MEENTLHNNLRWIAERAGFRLLALPSNSNGFESIIANQRDEFYGISTSAGAEEIIATPFEAARDKGIVVGDYPEILYEKARRIVTDMNERAKREGFGFFNGAVARVINAHQKGDNLQIDFERSSYFSDLNMPIGYTPSSPSRLPEPPLPPNYFWIEGDWKKTLPASPLAKQGNVQLIVHNDEELFYILRGRVAFGRSVVSGLPSGSIEPNENLGAPLHELAIRKEAEEEMGVTLGKVSWLGFGARTSDCGIMLLGTSHISLTREELEASIANASEGDEVGKLLSFSWKKASEDKQFLEQALSEKIVARHEEPGGHKWNSIGPTSLLLCLYHLLDPNDLDEAIRRIRVRYEAIS
jgi:8-oxo-dGTP pyrophosphatase MutT (NUDIX family)